MSDNMDDYYASEAGDYLAEERGLKFTQDLEARLTQIYRSIIKLYLRRTQITELTHAVGATEKQHPAYPAVMNELQEKTKHYRNLLRFCENRKVFQWNDFNHDQLQLPTYQDVKNSLDSGDIAFWEDVYYRGHKVATRYDNPLRDRTKKDK